MTVTPTLLPQPTDPWPSLNWQPEEAQRAGFQRLYEAIVRGNQQVNLTRLTEPSAFWEKHLWDSLYGIAPWLSPGDALTPLPPVQSVIDIGTGGGFPGLPVAMARPDWQVTLLDATRKKIAFLAELSQSLGLSNVQTLADRAESAGHHPQHREAYDLALIRAVGPAATCAEYALPFLKVGGVAVLYRGQWTDAEAASLRQAIGQLGGEEMTVQATHTPLSLSVRHCLYVRKGRPTPKQFPRAVGVPTKQPLG